MAQKTKKGTADGAAGGDAGAPGSPIVNVARVGVVLAGVAWGGTVAFAVSAMGWIPLGDLGGYTAPGGVALGIGGALAVAIAVMGLKQLGSRFAYVKPGQARTVRLISFVVLAALTLFGAATLYRGASPEDVVTSTEGFNWGGRIVGTEVFGQEFSIRPILFPSAAIFLSVVMTAYLLLNRPVWSDFLIETEGELKKVSWPKRQEYVGSSAVVVVVVVVVSMFLFFADMALSEFMRWRGIGF